MAVTGQPSREFQDRALAPPRRMPRLIEKLPEEGGRCIEAGGLPLRPDSVPLRTEGRQGAEAPAGIVRPAPLPGPGKDARKWDRLAWAGMQSEKGSSQPQPASGRTTPAGCQRNAEFSLTAEAAPERSLPGLRVPPAMPPAGHAGRQPQPPSGHKRERGQGIRPKGYPHRLTTGAHLHPPPRKRRRRIQRTDHHYHSLQARAIRDKRIYVLGMPEIRYGLSNYPKTVTSQ